MAEGYEDIEKIFADKNVTVQYAYQEKDDLPDGINAVADRVKPWGTGQAVLSVKGIVNEPFVVINADDYYGKEAFVKMYQYLESHYDSKNTYCN